MTQDSSSAVLVVEKFSQKDMDCCPKRIQGKVTHVFRKSKCGKGDAKRKVREGGLRYKKFSFREISRTRSSQRAHVKSYSRDEHDDRQCMKEFSACIEAQGGHVFVCRIKKIVRHGRYVCAVR